MVCLSSIGLNFILIVFDSYLYPHALVLNKNKDDGAVSMEELDRLQPELELMLSAAAVRSRTLQAELDTLNQAEDIAPDKATLILSQVIKLYDFVLLTS